MSSAFALNTDATLVLKDKNVSANDTGTCPALAFHEMAPHREMGWGKHFQFSLVRELFAA